MAEILTPDCPRCGRPPLFAFGTAQAFCGNDNCTLILWNPSATLDENLTEAGTVRLQGETEAHDGG